MATVAKRRWKHNGVEKEAWVVRYLAADGTRPSKNFEKKKDAEAYKRQVERELEDGSHIKASAAATFATVCKDFQLQSEARQMDGRIGWNRMRFIRQSIKNNIKPFLGEKRVNDLTVKDVEEFYGFLLGKRKLAVRTAKNHIALLGLVERFAIKRGLRKNACVTEAMADLRGTRHDPIKTFRSDQVAALLETAACRDGRMKERSRARMECFVALATWCGLRWGEIAALDVDHVDLSKRVVRVRFSMLYTGERKEPKTRAGIRDVPMPQVVADLIEAWVANHFLTNEANLIFTSSTGRHVQQSPFHLEWRKLQTRAGLGENASYHFHALRHFCSSWMIHNGLPLTDTAQLMGHSKFDMTLQVYAHPVMKPALRHEAMERMVSTLSSSTQMLTDAREPQQA